MSGVSYYGLTVVQPDDSISVDGDARFDPSLRYKENGEGDFFAVGPRLTDSAFTEFSPQDFLREVCGVPNDGVPDGSIICDRCQQRVAELLPEHRIAEHRCSRVLAA